MGRKTYQEAKNLWMVDCCIPKRQTMFFPNTKEPLPDATLVLTDPVAFVSALKQEENVWVVGEVPY